MSIESCFVLKLCIIQLCIYDFWTRFCWTIFTAHYSFTWKHNHYVHTALLYHPIILKALFFLYKKLLHKINTVLNDTREMHNKSRFSKGNASSQPVRFWLASQATNFTRSTTPSTGLEVSLNSTLSMTKVHTLSQNRYARSFSALKPVLFRARFERALLMHRSKAFRTIFASCWLIEPSAINSSSDRCKQSPKVVVRYIWYAISI